MWVLAEGGRGISAVSALVCLNWKRLARHVLPPLFPQRRCSQGAGGRLSVENAGQVKPAGAGATGSPVCCTSDCKQSGSLLLHPKAKGGKKLG